MINVVTFASAPIYEQHRAWLDDAARDYPGMRHFAYTQEWLKSTEYYAVNKSILDEPRGAGYWTWKPFIILDTMDSLKFNDIVLYMDSSTVFSYDPTEWIMSVDDMKLVGTSFINKDWTKRDCFSLMNCDSEIFWEGHQVWAGCICCRKRAKVYAILEKWLHLCMYRQLVTDDPSIRQNFPSFKEHRHDQSILSILAIDNGIPIEYKHPFHDTM